MMSPVTESMIAQRTIWPAAIRKRRVTGRAEVAIATVAIVSRRSS
jgi:hypothetical protein